MDLKAKQRQKRLAKKTLELKQAKVRARQASVTSLESLVESTKNPTPWVTLKATEFEGLPLSHLTKQGLVKANYKKMTDIQAQSLPHSLCNVDILGAAKTGSGKTLAFLVPVLEILYKANWSQLDGLGALIISPTRELALQIFQVLRSIGQFHSFSAGLLIGGKDLKAEQERVGRMNILVATPGRLLQHLDQTPEFNVENVQVLVLDEADRILDSGFSREVNAILEHLPKSRQTLLFSATQTKSVRDLARLSLKNPEYIAVHDSNETATPSSLTQKYMMTPLELKLDTLFTFIKTHLHQKILVFASSCKQVRFIYESFCKLQPGMPLLSLYGKQKQEKRGGVFTTFCKKTSACLIATDVAARGLDFPAVDWVVQLDCPEDVATYIHRVGRTARNTAVGNALLLLTPSEAAFIPMLESSKIPITEAKVNPNRPGTKGGLLSLSGKLSGLCTESVELKYLAQKSFICYMRSIHLQKHKDVFNVEKVMQGSGPEGSTVGADAYATSLGLAGTPKIKFIKKSDKNSSRQLEKIMNADEIAESESESEEESKKVKTRMDKMFDKKNIDVFSSHYAKLISDDVPSATNEEDDLLILSRKDHDLSSDLPDHSTDKPISTRKLLKLKQKALKSAPDATKLVFDDEGTPINLTQLESIAQFIAAEKPEVRRQVFVEKEMERMKAVDGDDKLLAKQKRRELKLLKKMKLKEREFGPSVKIEAEDEEEEEGGSASPASYPGSNSDSDDQESDEEMDEESEEESGSEMEIVQEEPKHGKRKRQPTSSSRKKVDFNGMDQQSLEEMALSLLSQ